MLADVRPEAPQAPSNGTAASAEPELSEAKPDLESMLAPKLELTAKLPSEFAVMDGALPQNDEQSAESANLETADLDEDCGSCIACLDKVKFGGSGRKRKGCFRRASAVATLAARHPKTARPSNASPFAECDPENQSTTGDSTAFPVDKPTSLVAGEPSRRRSRTASLRFADMGGASKARDCSPNSKLVPGQTVWVREGQHTGCQANVVGDLNPQGRYSVRIESVGTATFSFRPEQLDQAPPPHTMASGRPRRSTASGGSSAASGSGNGNSRGDGSGHGDRSGRDGPSGETDCESRRSLRRKKVRAQRTCT